MNQADKKLKSYSYNDDDDDDNDEAVYHWLLQEHELNRHVQNIKIDPNNPKAPNVRDGFKKKEN